MSEVQEGAEESSKATKRSSRIVNETTRRMERNKAFDEFRSDARELITPIAESLPQWRDYDDFYRANVLPGGWDGGANEDHVDVIFGNRPVHAFNRPDSSGFYSERGAWLRYERTLAGQINVFLFPPVVSVANIQYDNIVVLDKLDSAKGLTKYKLSQHMRGLSAWMAGGMLDQVITLSQRPTYAFIWACKPYLQWDARIEQYVLHHPRILTWFGGVAKWTLTVGLSGALLFVLQRCAPPEDTISPLLRDQTNSIRIESSRTREGHEALLEEGRRLRDTAEATLSEVRGLREDVRPAGQEVQDNSALDAIQQR